MATATRPTHHDEIRRWMEERGCRPAHVKNIRRKRRCRGSCAALSKPGGDNDWLEAIAGARLFWLSARSNRHSCTGRDLGRKESRFLEFVER